jgi:hypothetical protein
MSITLSPLSPLYSPLYSVTTDSIPYVPTSLPINTTQDVVVTSDYPLVFSQDSNNLSIAPIYPMYPFSISRPVVVPYADLNKDKDIVNRLVKYFYYKTLDKWLYDDELFSLLRYLKVSGDKVHVIKSEDDKDKHNISQEDADKKIEYIEHELLSKDDMDEILSKLYRHSNVKYIDMPKNEYVVIAAVKRFLKSKFHKLMSK